MSCGAGQFIYYGVSRGVVLDVPTLNDSPWVYECEVERLVETGESVTFFCHIRNIQVDENLTCEDTFDVDLTVLDPVIYSGRYHSLGSMLGKIGDFNKNAEVNAGNTRPSRIWRSLPVLREKDILITF